MSATSLAMSSTMESNDSWSIKNGKLRAACNQCHAAKVRCSGEKDGCKRCQHFHHTCEYSVSRVGKVPGNRSKNKRMRTSSEQSSSNSPDAAQSSTKQSTRESTKEPVSDSSTFSLYDDLDVNWAVPGGQTESYDFSAFDGDTNSFLGCQGMGSMFPQTSNPAFPDFPTPSSDFSLHMQSLGLIIDGQQSPPTMEECENSSVSTNTTKSPAAPPRQQRSLQKSTSTGSNGRAQDSTPPYLPSPPYPLQRRQSSKNRCVLACAKIIEELEVKINDDSTALDEVMRINKASVCEIARIMNLEEFKESASCPLLISIAMGQIIALFESSIRSEGFSQTGLGALPHLRFGTFQVDPEEQIALRAHIICNELRRSIQVLETLSSTLRNASAQAVQNASIHKQWSADMARRLEALIVAVEE